MDPTADRAPHLDPRRIAGYLDRTLPVEERSVVEEHLAGCAECRGELVAIGAVLESYEAPPSRSRGPRRWAVPAGVVAAAAAIAAVLIAVPRAGDTPTEVLRRPEAPTGAGALGRVSVAAPGEGASLAPDSLLFRWDELGEDVAYQFTLADAEGAPLWTGRTGATSLRLPPEPTGLLEPGRTYYWRVDALLPDLTSATSGQRSFRVRAP